MEQLFWPCCPRSTRNFYETLQIQNERSCCKKELRMAPAMLCVQHDLLWIDGRQKQRCCPAEAVRDFLQMHLQGHRHCHSMSQCHSVNLTTASVLVWEQTISDPVWKSWQASNQIRGHPLSLFQRRILMSVHNQVKRSQKVRKDLATEKSSMNFHVGPGFHTLGLEFRYIPIFDRTYLLQCVLFAWRCMGCGTGCAAWVANVALGRSLC